MSMQEPRDQQRKKQNPHLTCDTKNKNIQHWVNDRDARLYPEKYALELYDATQSHHRYEVAPSDQNNDCCGNVAEHSKHNYQKTKLTSKKNINQNKNTAV